MTLQIGVIGVGMIGQDHIRRLTTTLAGASIIAVSDVDEKQAHDVAARIDSKTYATGEELIAFVNGSTIEVVPPQGGVAPHAIFTAGSPINSIAWTRDSQKIAFGSGGQLAWISRNGGNSTPMAAGLPPSCSHFAAGAAATAAAAAVFPPSAAADFGFSREGSAF